MKAPSPLLGFNNNVRHKGRVFHIQTEDSGIRHPHVITHLFADGGRILKTTKTSYAEHIGNDRLTETVRGMMQEQHKAMFIALRDGQYDYLFDDSGGARKAPPEPPSSKPSADAPSSKPSVESLPSQSSQPSAEARSSRPTVDSLPAAARSAPLLPPSPPPPAEPEVAARPAISTRPTMPDGPRIREAAERDVWTPEPSAFAATEPARRAFAPTEPARRAADPASIRALADQASPTSGRPSNAPESVAGSRRRGTSRPTLDVDAGGIHGVASGEPLIDVDLDALERAAAEAHTPYYQQIQDLPPPPATVLGNKRTSTGGYSQRSGLPPPGGSVPPRAPTPPLRPGSAPSPGRYAPSRPASIFATTRPQEGASIFGEDLISEKSLDEVILGYLAEDLDGAVDKK